MKRILSLALSVAITIASFGLSSYCNQHFVSADQVDWPSGPDTVAETAVLIEASTGTVLYNKKCHKKMYPASITKIMTALLTIENCSLDDTVTFSQSAVQCLIDDPEAASIGAVEGEQMSVKDCLYALMLKSANEVASALAEHVSGDIDSFAELMTERAKQAGATDTNFVNANGLFNKKHYVTAYDMAKIMQAALQYPVFREIINSENYTLPADTNRKETLPISQRHQMVQTWNSFYYDGIIGGKTGYVDQSGTTLVTSAERNGMTLICVVLNSPNINCYKDTTALFDYGFNNFEISTVSDYETRFENSSSFVSNFDSIFDTKADRLYISDTDKIVLPKDANLSDTTSSITMNTDESSDNNIVATINYSYGEIAVGTASVLYGGTKTASTVNATIASVSDTQETSAASTDNKDSDNDETKITEQKSSDKKSDVNIFSIITKVIVVALVLIFLTIIILLIKRKHDRLNAARAAKRRRNR